MRCVVPFVVVVWGAIEKTRGLTRLSALGLAWLGLALAQQLHPPLFHDVSRAYDTSIHPPTPTPTPTHKRRVQELEGMGRLTGVIDDRGKFIHVERGEMEKVRRSPRGEERRGWVYVCV